MDQRKININLQWNKGVFNITFTTINYAVRSASKDFVFLLVFSL